MPSDRLSRLAALSYASAFLVACATPQLQPKPPEHDAFQIPDELKRKPSRDDRFKIPNSVIVCSWNIKWFGRSAVSKYDFVTMADFVEECDVTAIQELQNPNHAAVIAALLTELTNRGFDYDSRTSANTGYKNNPDSTKNNYLERYAFLWDTDSISLKGTPSFVSAPEINNATYRQVPYVADFKVKTVESFPGCRK